MTKAHFNNGAGGCTASKAETPLDKKHTLRLFKKQKPKEKDVCHPHSEQY